MCVRVEVCVFEWKYVCVILYPRYIIQYAYYLNTLYFNIYNTHGP